MVVMFQHPRQMRSVTTLAWLPWLQRNHEQTPGFEDWLCVAGLFSAPWVLLLLWLLGRTAWLFPFSKICFHAWRKKHVKIFIVFCTPWMNYGLSETNCIAHQISLISCRRSEFLISFFGNFVGHTFSSQELYSHSTFWKNFPDQHNRGISLLLKTQNLNHFPPVTQYLRLTLSIHFDCKDLTHLRISCVRAHPHKPEQKIGAQGKLHLMKHGSSV